MWWESSLFHHPLSMGGCVFFSLASFDTSHSEEQRQGMNEAQNALTKALLRETTWNSCNSVSQYPGSKPESGECLLA